MMSHGLDVPKAPFQRAGGSKRRRSRNAATELHCPYRTAHGVGTCKQQIRSLLQRVGHTVNASLPRFTHSVEKQ
jgi:hypothetical protein